MDVKLFAFFLTILFVTGIGFALGFFLKSWSINRSKRNVEEKLSRMRIDVQDEIAQQKEQSNRELEVARTRLDDREQFLDQRETKLDTRQEYLDTNESRLQQLQEVLDSRESELDINLSHSKKELERLAGLSTTQAHAELLQGIEQEYADSLTQRIYELERSGEEQLEAQSREILAASIQRFGNTVDNDMLSTYVNLPDDEIKGKIIGKEGRNIKAFEKETGVQLVIDDTPGQITISSFDPIRRAVAKTALEALVKDGRIQPARIEEVVQQSRDSINETIISKGQEAAQECGVTGLPKELLHILGRLYYRYSFGQNVLQHSVEMSHIAKVMATELGADVYVARAAALLHDIGKAVDHEVEGTHVEIGRRILQKYGVDEAIIKAMQAHHEEYPYETIESRIVQTVDAISGSRPGARSDNADMFLQKVEGLERIARAIDGVKDAYAVAAGREVRIFVNPEVVNDYQAAKIATKVAKQVEQELKYPGEIKVVVIRENRTIQIAR